MSGKPLNGNGNGRLLGATVLSPADFPLGSPQSRAAARVMLTERRPKLSSADKQRRAIVDACKQWVLSHDRGPMYWLRQCTKTENYHWKEQGLPAVAPIGWFWRTPKSTRVLGADIVMKSLA
jgi:hypothetical protein